jgi:hypothetical protein
LYYSCEFLLTFRFHVLELKGKSGKSKAITLS